MNQIIAIPLNSNSYNELELDTLIACPIKFKAINVSNFDYYNDDEIEEECLMNYTPTKIQLLEVIIYKKTYTEFAFEFALLILKILRKIITIILILVIYDIFLNFLMIFLIPKTYILFYIDQFSILLILNSIVIGICLWNLID